MTYSKLYDFTSLGHAVIIGIMKITEDNYGAEHIAMRIEDVDSPDNFAEIMLPEYNCRKSYGFTEDDLMKINDYLLHNEALIWDYARGVICCA